MKKVNTYYRKHGTCQGCEGVTDARATQLDQAVKNGYSWETAPFPKYQLTNNGAEIRRAKQRLEQLTQDRAVGFQGWEFDGGTAEINTDLDRLQFFFNEKPDDATRADLKSGGFHWSPTEGAWQRQLNSNAIHAANYIPAVQPKSGERPTALQPKAPKRAEPEPER